MTLNVSLGFPDSSSKSGDGPIPGIVVHRYQIRDALSELYEMSIVLMSTEPSVDMHAVVGERIVVTFHDEPAVGQGQVEGIVKSVRQLSSVVVSSTTQGASGYEVVVVPPLWLTTRRRDHRIFERKNAADIVAEVLSGYGGRIPAPVQRFKRAPQVREYVAQYGETDYEFISRVLSADFLTSFFDHKNGGAYTLVDDTSKMTSAPSEATPFLPPSNLITPPPHVLNVVLSSNIETSEGAVRDYDYEHAQLDLDGKSTASPAGGLFKNEEKLEAYAFEIGEFQDKGAGDERAAHLVEALRARARTYTLEANFAVGPGRQIKVSGHPRSDVNDTFLVIRTRIICDDGADRGLIPAPQPTATFVLECIPASVPFLPVPRPKPLLHGTQTGTIVGGADGDVVADSMSRVHVLFKWDRQKVASKKTRPVRVSQAWAGSRYGFFVMPRVGDEVVIAYLDGDPDEPLVVGRVHNNLRPNPVNPEGDEKTISKWRSQTLGDPSGFNEVLMDDLKSKERLELHAQRDYKRTVEHDSTLIVKHSEWLTVGANKTDKIGKAYSMQAGSITLSTGPYTLQATDAKILAKETIYMEAGNWVAAKAPLIELIGASSVHVSGGDVFISGGKIELKAGGSKITIQDNGIDIESTGEVKVKGSTIYLN